MNEEYLINLHSSLGVKDDYATWINAVKDNDDYLTKLHSSLDVEDDFATWKGSIMGKTIGSADATPNGGPSNTGSRLGRGSSGQQEIDDGFDDDMGILQSLTNTFENLKTSSIKQYYETKLNVADFIQSNYGHHGGGSKAAAWILGEDVGSKGEAVMIDPDNGREVSFNKKAYEVDGHDAIENKRYYELDKLRKAYAYHENLGMFSEYSDEEFAKLTPIKTVYKNTGEDLKEVYAEGMQNTIKKSWEQGEKMLRISDKGITGFTDALKKGELDDMFALSLDFMVNTTKDAGLAYVTGGLSMATQIYGAGYSVYNDEKSKLLYGEDDPDRFKKLILNDEDEVAIPGALAGLGFIMEKAGYRGMTKEIMKRSFGGKKAVSLFLAGNMEGWTEYGQGLTERMNKNLGQGMSVVDGVVDVAKYMWTEEAFDQYFAGLIGGTGLSTGGSIVQGALRSDENSNIFINKNINATAALLEGKARAKTEKEQKKYDDAIQVKQTELKEYLETNKKLGDYLDATQVTDLTSLVNNRRDIAKKIRNLQKGFKKGVVSKDEYNSGIKDLKGEITSIDASIETIKTEANMVLLKQDLDAGSAFVGNVDGLEQDVYDTPEEFFKALEQEYKALGKEMPNFEGVNVHGLKIGKKFLINAKIAAEVNAVATSTHEVLHGIVKSTVQADDGSGLLSADGVKIVKSFISQLSSKEKGLIEGLLKSGKYKINKDGTDKDFKEYGEEYLTMYAQLAKEGRFTKNNIQKAGIWFGRFFNKETEFKKISFKDGESTRAFLDAYAGGNKVALEQSVALAKEGVKMKETPEQFSKDQTDSVNELSEMGWTDKTWKESGADFAIKEMQSNKMLDGLIRSKYKADTVPDNFVDLVYSELVNHVKNFKPESNDSLFGWVNSQIANKAGNVYNREFKVADEMKGAKDIGKTTKEGEVKVQVAAETDSRMEALETEDLSPAAQAKKKADKAKGKEKVESKFRRQIGIETGSDLYNKVLDTARKSLLRAYEAGTSVRNIQRKLRDEANVYLFKDIKNFLGTKDYIKRLKEFRVPIMNSIFTADLVQMERNTPESERVFTRFVRKLTSKADVQAAVDQNLLPVSALNIIDKGTAVSLYEKANPTEAQFMSYFDIPTINPKTGARSGTRGTRKDQLAKNMAGSLSYDATMEVAQEPSTMKKRGDIAEIKGEVLPQDNLEVLAAAINRDVNVKFSKSINPSKLKNTTLYLQSIENKLDDGNNIKPFFELTRTLVEEGFVIEDAVAIAKQSLPTQSDVLDLILNNGNFNTLHVDNIIWGINNFVLPKVRKLGHDTSVKYLEQQINGKSIGNKVKLTNEYLANIGRPTRSAGVDGITTNQQLYDEVIVPLGLGDQYRLVDASIRGQKLQYKKGDKFIDVELYENIENIKNNAYENSELVEKINNQAKQAKDYVFKILDSNLTEAEKKAVVQLMAYDQRGALRKVSKLGMTTKGLDASKTVLEHEFTIKDLQDKVNDYIDGKINKDQLEKIFDDGRVHILPKSLDTILRKEKIGQRGGKDRYKNETFKKALNKLIESGVVISVKFSKSQDAQTLNNAINFSRSANNPTKGITVLDFDDTLATSKSMIRFTRPDGTKGKLNAEQYASTYEDLSELGYKWDFSEFTKVVDGKTAPLFNKAMKLQGKFGPENMFVLTARPMESAGAIHAFLKANGLNIPLKNITGLANSTAEAKALWMAEKVGEGYNDFYFADDALQNVKAVKNMLNQLDVKSKVQQARVKFSKSMDEKFNDILENVTGIGSVKRFSEIKGRKRGDDKGKFRLFIPPSHEDFVGLLYNFMGKGREGDKHRDFFEQALVRPINRAYREIDTAKQAIANDYKALNKKFPEIKDKLIKTTPDGDFTFSDAIRVYLWTKHGHKIPGLTETDQAKLTELVQSDPQLQAYAETLNIISKQETYVAPGQAWEMGNIRIDLVDATGRVGRAEYFSEFQENADVIFSEENLNKIEAGYGKDFRSALEDMLHRIKTGVNRPKGESGKPNAFMNWLNASVSGVMFFNTRSALLQQMSNVNYLNFADNNIFKAGLAFANQKQYWADFAMIFNSDMLKQRRGGLGTDINGAELAEAIKKARPDSMFDQVAIITGKALKLGFLPTQIGDNIAIATGGAAFYRNRVNTYLKQGISVKDAESKAFTDFQNITQSTQQSARPDMTSQQQASWIGKIVLNFLNTPSQYNRIIKKAALDIKNRRITGPNTSQTQSDMSNMSRILYYGAAQNLIFYSLQTALFAVMFGGEEDEEALLTKKERVIQGSIDTILRGSGIYGVAVSTLKNMAIKFMEQREKGYNKDESAVIMEMLNFSPVVGIKTRKVVNAEKTLNYNKKVIEEMETFDIDNPQWSAVTNYVEAITTAPVNRLYQKSINLRNASDNQYTALQRILFLSGYTTWSLNLGDTEKMEKIKQDLKDKKKKSKKEKKSNRRTLTR